MKKLLIILLIIFNTQYAHAQKVQDLTEDTSPASTDLGYTIKNPSTTPVGRKATWANLMKLSGWIDGGTTVYSTTTTDNVAIGTTAASTKLTVLGTVTATAFAGDGSQLTGISGVGVGTASPNGWTDGGTNVYVTTVTDTVGIGTTTPTGALDVRGDEVRIWTGGGSNTNAVSSGELYVQGDLEVDGTIYSVSPEFTTSVISPKVVGGSSTTQSLTYQTTSGVGTTGADHIFKVGNAGATEAMRILNGGNVGIGSASPNKPLEIVTTSNNGMRVLFTGSSSSSNDARIAVGSNDGAAVANGDKLGSYVYEGNDGTGVFEGGAVVAKANGTWTNTSHPTRIYFDTTAVGSTTRTDRGGIDSEGRWGVGTFNPTSSLTVIKRTSENVLSVSSAASQLNDYLVIGSAGNVGIGTPLPQTLVQVKGGDVKVGAGSFTNTSSNEDLSVAGNIQVNGFYYGDGSQLTGISAAQGGGFTDGGVNVYTSTTTDNVGIGTTTPSTTLEVVQQTARAPLMISTVPTGDGDLLIVKSDGNVGIGSILPGAKVDINGTLRASSLVGLGTTLGVFQFKEAQANGDNYIELAAPNSLSANTRFYLPTADGNAGEAMTTNGAGVFSFTAIAAAGGWTDGGTNVYQTTTTDTVGIGTTVGSGTLEIVQQGSVAPFMVSSVATGDGNRFIVTSSGNVGIGTILTAVDQNLVVHGGIKSNSTASTIFAPTDSPTACAAGTEGGIYYDNSLNEFCDCDGSSWAQIDGGGAC